MKWKESARLCSVKIMPLIMSGVIQTCFKVPDSYYFYFKNKKVIFIGGVFNMMYTFLEQPVVPAVLVSSRTEVTILFDLHTVSPCSADQCLPVAYTCLTKMLVGCCYFFYFDFFISFFIFSILFLFVRKACSISDLAQYNAISLIL